MKTTLTIGASVAMLVGLSPSLSAQILLEDNFDSYTDQAAFQAAWPVVGSVPSATLSTAQSVSSPNSVFIPLTTSNASTPRHQRTFAESGVATPISAITFSFSFFDSNAALNPYRQYANLQDGTGPSSFGQLISMGLNNNQTSAANGGNYYMARILGYTPTDTGGSAGSYFKLNDAGAPLRSTGWHELSVTISDVDFKFYVDGILSETVAQTGTLRSYDVVRLGSGVTATAEAYYDNMMVSIAAVPEPGAFAAVFGGLALAGALLRRRFQK